MDKRVSSKGSVLFANGVEKQCSSANCSVVIVLLRANAPAPTPVLKLPVLFENSEYQPTPVFAKPVVREFSALHPSAVVKLG